MRLGMSWFRRMRLWRVAEPAAGLAEGGRATSARRDGSLGATFRLRLPRAEAGPAIETPAVI